MKNPYALILLVAATTAYGQINNPPTSVNIVDSTATGRAVLTATNAAAARTSLQLVGSGFASFNSGSQGNDASGDYASTVGGALNTASGNYSFAAGRTAKATNEGAFVWADSQNGDFSSFSSNTFNVRASGGMSLDLSTNGISFRNPEAAATTRTNLGLGATNNVTFSNVTVAGALTAANIAFTNTTYTNPTTFATNVTVGGTLAVTDNVTMSGVNNTMPNATNAASGASLMTRSLTDLQMFGLLGLYDPVRLASATVTGTNGGGFDNYGSSYDLRTGTNAAGAVVYNAGAFSRQTTAGSAANAAWGNGIVVAWPFNRASSNNEVRLQYGRSTSANTHGALTARGIGIRINGNNMFFETHDGTTAFETTNAVPLTHNFGQDVFWAISESGVVRFYRGQNTLLATVTNNAPTNGASDNNTGWIISISNTAAANSIFRVQNNPGFVLQQ